MRCARAEAAVREPPASWPPTMDVCGVTGIARPEHLRRAQRAALLHEAANVRVGRADTLTVDDVGVERLAGVVPRARRVRSTGNLRDAERVAVAQRPARPRRPRPAPASQTSAWTVRGPPPVRPAPRSTARRGRTPPRLAAADARSGVGSRDHARSRRAIRPRQARPDGHAAGAPGRRGPAACGPARPPRRPGSIPRGRTGPVCRHWRGCARP
jgi:hypothetical protein